MGISKYKYVRPLTYADKDAELFRDYLKSPGGGSVKNENIFCLLNEKAVSSNFWGKGFQWLKAKDLQRGDRLFIYLAGHGDAIDEDQFFFLSYDCNPAGDKNNYLVAGTIQLFNLKKKIANETGKGVEVFFIMDACRSHELPGGIPGQNFLNSAVSQKRAGEIIMLATGAGQESLEDASIGNGHGLFTYYLVDGLNGAADSLIPDQKISFREIESYVKQNVPSVAQQRFQRKQDPFFCCNENNDKIISNVDTAYLRQWMRLKKQQTRTPGNSFPQNSDQPYLLSYADTTLIETYDLFNRAVSQNRITGRNSAEFYFQQLDRKFPGNPYTLDAKSTLAVEYINFAQDKINLYLDCGDESGKQRLDDLEAGTRLEKAIAILKEDEPEYANTLLGKMYFLKASGEGTINRAFQNAYAAYSIDRNSACITNRLSTLHLQNKRLDSALYYAKRTIQLAPKWQCGYGTLGNVYKGMDLPDSARKYQQRPTVVDTTRPVAARPGQAKTRTRFGILAGGGITNFGLNLSNWKQRNVNYNDTLNSLTARGHGRFEFGLLAQIFFNPRFSWRIASSLSLAQATLNYNRKSSTGGPANNERVSIQTNSLNISAPFIITSSKKKAAPYFSIGPGINYILTQDNASKVKFPLQAFAISAEAGLGIDIVLPNTSVILSPEVKFARGLNNLKQDLNTTYTNTISNIRRQEITFTLYVRKN
jgi:hypothetical protein